MIEGLVPFCATRFVEPGEHRDAFQQRRFASTVFPDDDSDRLFEIKAEAVFEQRKTKRIGFRFFHQTTIKHNALKIRCREINDPLLSTHNSYIQYPLQVRKLNQNPLIKIVRLATVQRIQVADM